MFVKPSLMKGSCQLQYMLCTKLYKSLLKLCFQHHLPDAAVDSEGKQQTVAELHRGSGTRQQAAKMEMLHMLMAVAMLTKTTMRRQIQVKGCVSYALKTEAIWCFKHAVICAHATNALLISTGVLSVEPGPEPSECTMLESTVPVLCAEVCGVDVPSQMAVCVLYLSCCHCTIKAVMYSSSLSSLPDPAFCLSLFMGSSFGFSIKSTIDLAHHCKFGAYACMLPSTLSAMQC